MLGAGAFCEDWDGDSGDLTSTESGATPERRSLIGFTPLASLDSWLCELTTVLELEFRA